MVCTLNTRRMAEGNRNWVRQQIPEGADFAHLDDDLYDENSLFDVKKEHDLLIHYYASGVSSCPTETSSSPGTGILAASGGNHYNEKNEQKQGSKRRPFAALTQKKSCKRSKHDDDAEQQQQQKQDKTWNGYRKWYWTLLSLIESKDSTYAQKMKALFEMVLFLQTGWRKTCPVAQRLIPWFQLQQAKLKYSRYLDHTLANVDQNVDDAIKLLDKKLNAPSIRDNIDSSFSAAAAAFENLTVEDCIQQCDPTLLKRSNISWERIIQDGGNPQDTTGYQNGGHQIGTPQNGTATGTESAELGFVSARQQLRKDQKGGKPPGPRRPAPVEQPNAAATGKRKFVPPVRRGSGGGEQTGIDTAAKTITRKSQKKNNNTGEGEDDDYSFLEEGEELPPELEGVEPRMIKLILNQIMDSGESVTFDDIAGLQHAKRNVVEMVVWPMKRPDLFTGLRSISKGLLLFGPPGTGKTLIGKAIAHQCDATFFSISASALTSKWIGEGEKMVRALFAVATWKQPSVIFIDEVDSLLTSRSENENESSRRIKTEFLVNLDGAGTKRTDQVLVVGATNRPQELDEAARRRFVKRLYIPLPNEVGRATLVKHLLFQNANTLTEEDIKEIVTRTQGYSGSDIAQLCREAAMGPVRRKLQQLDDISNVTPDMMPPITMSDFLEAFPQIPKSVAESELQEYIKWNKEFGSVAIEHINTEEGSSPQESHAG